MEKRVNELEHRTNRLEKTVTEHSVTLEHHGTIFGDLKTAIKELAVNVNMNNSLLERRNAVDTFIWKMLGAISVVTATVVAIVQLVN